MSSCIEVRGARTHNLKNISFLLPKNRLIVITGPSGSGKSSLAFDTLYAEGQRRYVESLSTYARQFLQPLEKPDVDAIEGLSPAIAIEQKKGMPNPRSTVGTVTEITDHLRLLWARVGVPHCPRHPQVALEAKTVSQVVDALVERGGKIMILAPLLREKKGEHASLFTSLARSGFLSVRVDGGIFSLDHPPRLGKNQRHTIELVVDSLSASTSCRERLAESLELAFTKGEGRAVVSWKDEGEEEIFSQKLACPFCDFALAEMEPRLFSFNSPQGACPKCGGLGVVAALDPQRLIVHPELPLALGAIAGWDRRNPFFLALVEGLAQGLGFDPKAPFAELSPEIQEQILFGTKKKIQVALKSEKGSLFIREEVFPGVVPLLEKRYEKTPSMREELGRFFHETSCPQCQGTRLREEARHVLIEGKALPEVASLSLQEALSFFSSLPLAGRKKALAERLLQEITQRLSFLLDVGLGYLTLARQADTLSGGEAQRIRLASQVGSGLTGVLYVLDEPSIGLHPRDESRLIATLCRLRDLGNTVVVVEHDEEMIRAADHVVDMGPGAGVRGGEITAQGTSEEIASCPHSLTGQYLGGAMTIQIPEKRRLPTEKRLKILGACANNLKNLDVEFPLGLFICVTGVSGSGKSTLVNDTLFPALARAKGLLSRDPAACAGLEGAEHIEKTVAVDQSPIGRTPRSNPATYTGLFSSVRDLFAATPKARERGYGPGRFSFNVDGGRCEACQGEGVVRVEMHFLPDVYVTCEVCEGKRYNRQTLDVTYKGKNIHEVLSMTVAEARGFFRDIPSVAKKLDTLFRVGLDYLSLGQPATTLSGGEAQRVKLASELSRRDAKSAFYILDEPTTGLHFHDVAMLLSVLEELVCRGNTVLVIEHHLDVIKVADWVIDLGPEGGENGGQVIAQGSPDVVAENPHSHTGKFLKQLLAKEATLRS